MKSTKRILSLEVLRVVSMLMIIWMHMISYSNIYSSTSSLQPIYFTKEIIHSICLVAVNCYILISGYFCIKSEFKIKKLLYIVFETLFYSVVIYLMFLLSGKITFSFKDLFFNFLPTLTRQYWFVTTYVGVYILSPFIKKISQLLDQKTHFSLLLILFLLLVVYYNFFFFCDNLNFGGATGIVWFTFLFFVGTYIYKYYKPDYKYKNKIKTFLLIQFISFIVKIGFLLIYKCTNNILFLKGSNIFNSVYNSIFCFLSSISFFLIFLNINIKEGGFMKKIIIFLSSSSFGVYLIHENRYIRDYIWNLKIFNYQNNLLLFIIYSILFPIIIYAIFMLIDKIRLIVFDFTFNKFINKFSIYIDKIFIKSRKGLYKKVECKNEDKY